MWIVDKKGDLINITNAEKIYIEHVDRKLYDIVAKIKYFYPILGRYNSKERTEEVLHEIKQHISMSYTKLKVGDPYHQNGYEYPESIFYEMPKE